MWTFARLFNTLPAGSDGVTEADRERWFEAAGFADVRLTRIGPSWYEGERGHGLIMGCSVTGVKPEGAAGASPGLEALLAREEAEEAGGAARGRLSVAVRSLLGSVGGLFYFFLPIYMYCKYQLRRCLRLSW